MFTVDVKQQIKSKSNPKSAEGPDIEPGNLALEADALRLRYGARQAKTNLLPLPVIEYSWISKLIDDYYDRTDYCNQGQ